MANGTFRDFIPAGEATDHQGRGFTDFVPDPEPVKHEDVVVEPVEEVTTEEVVSTPKKKRGK